MLNHQKSKMSLFFGVLLFTLLILNPTSRGLAQPALDRPYEPVVLLGAQFPAFLGLDVDLIRVYRINSTTDAWEPVPFQVDEKDGTSSYIGMKNGVLDNNDEIVFLSPDGGDVDPSDNWIDDNDARLHARYDITLTHPQDPSKRGWVTIYASSTLPESSQQYVVYDQDNDRIQTKNYEVIHGSSGFQQSLLIRSEAGGDGIDFLDRQKVRLKLHLDLGLLGTKDIWLKEEMDDDIEIVLGVSGHVRVRAQNVDVGSQAVVRVQRELILEVSAQGPGIDINYELPFVTTFYPSYAEWKAPSLEIPTFSIGEIKEARLSSDLSEQSGGMQFVSPHNPDGFRIDGIPEDHDATLNWPGYNWSMVVADPAETESAITVGSVVTLLNFIGDPLGDEQNLYYRDFALWPSAGDTGDKRSYGESGVQVKGDNISGLLDFYSASYYIAANLDTSQAGRIARDHFDPLLVAIQEDARAFVQIVIDTEPAGLTFHVDGNLYDTPQSFLWIPGSIHAVGADLIQDEANGSRFVFSSWSSGGERNHNFTTPAESTNLTAFYGLQHYLTTSTEPENTGQIYPEPPGTWWPDNAWAVVEAESQTGYRFLEWSGDLTSGSNPDSLLMDGPKSVTAHFVNDPPVVAVFDTTLAEDDSLFIPLTKILPHVNDVNHPVSELDITLERGDVILVNYDEAPELFLIKSEIPDWVGVDTLTIKAIDPLGAVGTGPLVITVLPMPDPPSPFRLIDVADNTIITTWSESMEFSWEPAVDPDINDSLSYTIEIDTTTLFNSDWRLRVENIEVPFIKVDWPITHGDGVYYWRVQAQDSQGNSTWSASIHSFVLETGVAGGIPEAVVLQQNYPNPFNESTTIRFGVPEISNVTVTIFDSQGRRVRRLVDGEKERGYHPILWNGIDDRGHPVASGLYFVMMRSGSKKYVKRLVCLR